MKTLTATFFRLAIRTSFKEQFYRVQKVFWHLLCKWNYFFFMSYEVVRNNFSKKSSRWKKKILAFFLPKKRVLQTLSNSLLGSTSFLSIYDASSKIISSTPMRLLKTKSVEKKLLFQLKTLKATFFRLQNRTSLGEHFWRVQKFFDIYCANDNIFSLGPMRSLETTFQKNGYHPGEKNFGLFSLN